MTWSSARIFWTVVTLWLGLLLVPSALIHRKPTYAEIELAAALVLVLAGLLGGVLPDVSWVGARGERPGWRAIASLAVVFALLIVFLAVPHSGRTWHATAAIALASLLAAVLCWLTLGADRPAALVTLALAVLTLVLVAAVTRHVAVPVRGVPSITRLPTVPRLTSDALLLALLASLPMLFTARMRLTSALRLSPALAAVAVALVPVLLALAPLLTGRLR